MALTIDQQIEEIEKEIRKTPYHKGTERHIGLLKAKIARLKVEKEARAMRGSSGRGASYGVRKQGDATVVLVGPPSVGKSTLLNALTNAESKVAPYAFTTVSVIPGMMKYRYANIQLLDVPGLIEGAEEGKGRGREVLSVVRGADLLLLITDPGYMNAVLSIKAALERNGIKLDKSPPDIRIDKKTAGGIIVNTNLRQTLGLETIKQIVSQIGVKNAEVYLNEVATIDTLIDSISKNRVYIPTLTVINKADQLKKGRVNQLIHQYVLVSAKDGTNLDSLKKQIWARLGLVTVYLVRKHEAPSRDNPLIVKSDQTLSDVALKIGSDFAEGKKRAKIWGPGSKFPGQSVSLSVSVVDNIMVRFI